MRGGKYHNRFQRSLSVLSIPVFIPTIKQPGIRLIVTDFSDISCSSKLSLVAVQLDPFNGHSAGRGFVIWHVSKNGLENTSQAISFSSLSSGCLMWRARSVYNNQRCILFVKLGCLSSQMLWITFITLVFCRVGFLGRSSRALLSFSDVLYMGEIWHFS